MPAPDRTTLLRELRSVANSVPHAPNGTDITTEGDYELVHYINTFGSLEDALTAADLPTYNLNAEIPLETLLDDVHRVATIVGRRPRSTDVDTHGEYHPSTYINRCGDAWSDVLAVAGFAPVTTGDSPSKAELTADLERLYQMFGVRPTRWLLEDYSHYPAVSYTDEFGSLEAALDAADLPTSNYQISTRELVEELRRIAETLERTPTGDDIESHAEYGKTTYLNRFGRLAAAYAAAGLTDTDTPGDPIRSPTE